MDQDTEQRVSELESIVAETPGAPEFVELASILADVPERRSQAREICMRGLTENPRAHRGRLVLAKLYYLDEMAEFSVRELLELRERVGELPALDRLIEAFGPLAQNRLSSADSDQQGAEEAAAENKIVAEIDFDSELVDVLDELDEE